MNIRAVVKNANTCLAAVSLFAALGFLALASPVQAQPNGPRVTVVNPPSEPVPVAIVGTGTVNATVTGEVSIVGTPTVNANVTGEVSIAGTPTVNANVSGDVGIAGTPTVDVRALPGVSVGVYFTSCVFSGPFCQSSESKQAAPGTAFRIDAIQGRTFGTGTPDLSAAMSIGILTPGLGTSFEVPCINNVGFASCTATPGIHVTSFQGLNFTANAGTSARVAVYYTVVKLAP